MNIDLLKLLLIAALLVLALAAARHYLARRQRVPAPADSGENAPLALGIKAHMKGDYARAVPILRQHAEAGELKAQQLLARMYYSGQGVDQDLAQYRHWLERAAENGDRSARARLKKLRRRAAGERES